MHYRSTRRHTFLALLGAAGLVAGSGVAAAQVGPMALPGTDDSAIQFAVGTDLATVEVDDADADATEITGTFTNNSDAPLNCTDPDMFASPSIGGTVTRADLVDRSLDYITGNLVVGGGGLAIPGLDLGSLNDALTTGSLGSLGLGDDTAAELSDIQRAQNEARLDGHYGTVGAFIVNDGDTFNWSATLAVPTGDRTDFDAAALFTCSQDDQWYAFAGYEDVEDDNGNGGGGSLDMGSLGS